MFLKKCDSTDNSIIKEVESTEENQRKKIIKHVYLTYIKPVFMVNAEDNMNEVYGNEENTGKESI